MKRLASVVILLSLSTGCGWFAGLFSPADDAVPADAEAAPTCRPAMPRGDAPWAVGDTVGDDWTVSAVDLDHREYARFTLTKGEETTGLEVRFHEGEPGDWSTEHSALMPAPEEEPPQPLLEAAMAHLRAFDAARDDDEPFVERTEGVDDPYEGLPPCETEGEAAPS